MDIARDIGETIVNLVTLGAWGWSGYWLYGKLPNQWPHLIKLIPSIVVPLMVLGLFWTALGYQF